METLTDLLHNPAVLAALGALIGLVVQRARSLTYRELVTYQTVANRLLPILDPLARRLLGRPLIRERYAPTEDPDAVFISLGLSPRLLVGGLRRRGFVPSLLSTAKYRTTDEGGRDYADGQLIKIHQTAEGEMQTHVYYWHTPEGLDIYAHHEPAVTRPGAHNLGEQEPGDPHGHLSHLFGGDISPDGSGGSSAP